MNEPINEWGGCDNEGSHLGMRWSLGHCVETKPKMGRGEAVGQVLGCRWGVGGAASVTQPPEVTNHTLTKPQLLPWGVKVNLCPVLTKSPQL